MHLQQILPVTQSKSAKFLLRWSKVPRVLGPPNLVMAISGTRPVTAGGRFQADKKPKMAINRGFPGLRAFSANFGRDKIEESEIPHRIVKSAARFGAPKPSYGHFSHPAGHNRGGGFSSRKTPKMAINGDFPGLRAFSANFASDTIEEREIPPPVVKSAARFGAPKSSYGHFRHPASYGRGTFSSRENTQNGNKSRFPGATCIFGKFCE